MRWWSNRRERNFFFFLNIDINGVLFQGGSFFSKTRVISLSLLFWNKLRYCYFFFVWLWEVRVLTGKRRRGDTRPCRPRTLSSELFFLILLLIGWGLLAHVAEVRVRVRFGGQRLLAAATGRQQLSFLWVPPLHPPVLEPDFHLRTRRKWWVKKKKKFCVRGSGMRTSVFACKLRTRCWAF